jgi:hypothetical protein
MRVAISLILLSPVVALAAEPIRLFNGKDLAGWEGDEKTWRADDGAIAGGSLETTVPRNE